MAEVVGVMANRIIWTHLRPNRKARFACLGAAVLVLLGIPLRAEGPRTVVFFGDSITAGYGLADPAEQAYPALVAKRIAAAGIPWRVSNAGLSGETTAGGLRRIDWVLRQPADLVVLALGGNDGLRGVPPPETAANLRGIIGRIRARRPGAGIVLAGMLMPDSMGADYARQFASVFGDVAREERVGLIPFLLEGVGGRPELNQADGIHPNAAGHAAVAETVWRALRPLHSPPAPPAHAP